MNKKGSGWAALGALLLICAFFMPWFGNGERSVNGFALPRSPLPAYIIGNAWDAPVDTPVPEQPLPSESKPEPAPDADRPVDDDGADGDKAGDFDRQQLNDAVGSAPSTIAEAAGAAKDKAAGVAEKALEVVKEVADPERRAEIGDAVLQTVDDARALFDTRPASVDAAERRDLAARALTLGAYGFYVTVVVAAFALLRLLANGRLGPWLSVLAGLLTWALLLGGVYAFAATPWGALEPAKFGDYKTVTEIMVLNARFGLAVFVFGATLMIVGGLRAAVAWRHVRRSRS